MIAVDTNLLVYAHRAGVPEHRAARRALEKAAGRGWGIPAPCVAEFWSIVTHRDCAGGPSTPSQARDFVLSLIHGAGAALWLPRDGFGERLVRLAADLRVQGVRMFDVQIALTAWENGATELWTHDRRFVTVPGLRVHDPLAAR